MFNRSLINADWAGIKNGGDYNLYYRFLYLGLGFLFVGFSPSLPSITLKCTKKKLLGLSLLRSICENLLECLLFYLFLSQDGHGKESVEFVFSFYFACLSCCYDIFNYFPTIFYQSHRPIQYNIFQSLFFIIIIVILLNHNICSN